MFGDVFDDFVAMLVVKFLVDRPALDRRGHGRPRIDERLVPKLFDFEDFKLRAERLFEPNNDLLLEEIDDADEIVFAAKRELQRPRTRSEALPDAANHVIEIRA